MAQLLKHPQDCVRICPSCSKLTEAHYDGAQILEDDAGNLCEFRQYTCQGCRSSHNHDPQPRPGFMLMAVTDRREWHWRDARRPRLLESGRRYSIVDVRFGAVQ